MGASGIVPNNKDDMAGAAIIGADQAGDINTGNRSVWHGPGSGGGPVTAIVEAGNGIGDRSRLGHSQKRPESGDQPGAITLVIAEAIE